MKMKNDKGQPSNDPPDFSLNQQDVVKPLPSWEITATTIYCDVVKRYVALKIFKDWHIVCCYHQRRGNIRREKKKGILCLVAWLGIGGGEKYVTVGGCKGSEKCPKILECLETIYREEMALRKEEA